MSAQVAVKQDSPKSVKRQYQTEQDIFSLTF